MDLRSRLANRVQLTTDGHVAYVGAVERAFGSNVDYAQLIKHTASSTRKMRRQPRGVIHPTTSPGK